MFYQNLDKSILERAKNIAMLILDVDGVLSDGHIYINAQGEESKSFHTLDGHGIKMLQQTGIQTAIITGRDAPSVAFRVRQLGITHYMAGIDNKKKALEKLLFQAALKPEQCAYIGDDVVDLPVMTRVQLSIAPPQAHPLVIEHAHHQTTASAGKGAVREVCDLLLFAQGHYHQLMQDYLA